MIYRNYVKRILDLFLGVLILFATLIPMVLLALLIRFTTGDAPFFTQIRFGKNGVPFKLYKFRSMSAKAPILSNQDFNNLESYLTPIGRFIRNTSIDELPQLVNIIKGEMSFIGPRPLAETDKNVVEMREKLGADSVLPGITGYAQVNGRNNISDQEKAEFDFEYSQSLSFSMDMRIVIKTLFKVLKQEDVYKD